MTSPPLLGARRIEYSKIVNPDRVLRLSMKELSKTIQEEEEEEEEEWAKQSIYASGLKSS